MERIKQLMQRDGIKSQYQLAKIVGIRTTVINGWFTGKVQFPSDKHLNRLASYFHVEPAWIRYGDKTYAPSYDDDVQRIAEKIKEFGKTHPTRIKHVESMIDQLLLFAEGESDKSYPIPKKKRRKSA